MGLTIKKWAEEDRPREKLLQHGSRALTDAELLAILLRTGTTAETAVELARRILAAVNNDLNRLALCSINDLMKFRGVGQTKAITVAAAMELAKRKQRPSDSRYVIITSYDIAVYCAPFLEDLDHEEFWALLLNNANAVIGKVQIGRGGITEVSVDVRLLLKAAIERSATRIILVHNHPSGSIEPSQADMRITEKIVRAAATLDIDIPDHVIIGHKQYFSFYDGERLPKR
ncbi:MAG: DNA repair protein RadC [Bacteroidales bacterium]|jgi:DNA repair protein RadC|nr:DNA repair protein RadC [Bacteroidales bacterium]